MAENAIAVAIVHAEADQALGAQLADALEAAGFSFASAIADATVVVAVWSAHARASPDFLADAAAGARLGRLVQVLTPGFTRAALPAQQQGFRTAAFGRWQDVVAQVRLAADHVSPPPPQVSAPPPLQEMSSPHAGPDAVYVPPSIGAPQPGGSATPLPETPLNAAFQLQQLAHLREAAGGPRRSGILSAEPPVYFDMVGVPEDLLRGQPAPTARPERTGPVRVGAAEPPRDLEDWILAPGTPRSAPNDGPRVPTLPSPFGGSWPDDGRAPAQMRAPPVDLAPLARKRSSLVPLLLGTALAGGLAYLFADKLAGLAGALIAMIKGSTPPPPGAPHADPAPPTDIVDCSVFAPPAAPPGARIRIQVFLHLDSQLAKVAETAQRRDARAVDLGTQTLKCPVPRGAEVDIELQGDGLEANETSVSMGWHGRPDGREFIVRLPSDADGREFLPKIIVYLDGEPVGSLVFAILCQRQATEVVSEIAGRSARRFRKVFFSYSSQDRDKVAVVARSYSLIDQDFFQDILDLDPGERWERKLYEKIDECDLFMLFWSEAARRSEWVRREVEHALARECETGAPQFMPFPLGDPPPPQPWDSLKHRHLGDPLYFKLAEKRRRKRFWQRG